MNVGIEGIFRPNRSYSWRPSTFFQRIGGSAFAVALILLGIPGYNHNGKVVGFQFLAFYAYRKFSSLWRDRHPHNILLIIDFLVSIRLYGITGGHQNRVIIHEYCVLLVFGVNYHETVFIRQSCAGYVSSFVLLYLICCLHRHHPSSTLISVFRVPVIIFFFFVCFILHLFF